VPFANNGYKESIAYLEIRRRRRGIRLSERDSGSDPALYSSSSQTVPILLKALPLRNAGEISDIKEDLKKNTIVILKITPLAQRSIEDLKVTIEQLTEFALSLGGDIARLGEERIVVTPPGVKIWRGEKNAGSSIIEP
jgi:uncharacterized protein